VSDLRKLLALELAWCAVTKSIARPRVSVFRLC